MNLYSKESQYLITKSNKVNVRTGPNQKYNIKYIYTKSNTIVRLKNTFDDWYLVEDLEGDEGWAYKNILSSQKKNQFVTIRSHKDIFCYKKPRIDSTKSFKTSYLINFRVKYCNENWCLLEKDKITGWCQKKHLWGI